VSVAVGFEQADESVLLDANAQSPFVEWKKEGSSISFNLDQTFKYTGLFSFLCLLIMIFHYYFLLLNGRKKVLLSHLI
jgi:hypothetical protein